MPHANVPSQGAPVQHSPSSGPPVQQRDPAPGDPMPTVDDDAADPAVRTQSADTMTAPPPSALADQNNAPGNTPNSPQQAPQSSPQAAGPVMGAPGMAPQGTPTPTAAPPRGSTTPPAGNPPHGTPPNARPGGTPQRTPDRPAFTPRPDGPRPDQQRPRAGDPRTPHHERPGGIPSQQRPNGTGPQPPRQQQPQNDRPDPRQQPSQQRPAGENPDSGTPSSPTTPRPETPQHQSPDASQAPTGTDNGDPRADRPQDSRPDQPDGPSNRAPDTDSSNTSDNDNDNRNESDSGNNADSGPDKDSNDSATDSGNDSDPSNQRPDHPDATDESTSPRDQDSDPTPDTDPDSDAAHDPAPASETRNRERPGGLEGPTDEHQQHVENSIPKDENGEPQRHPDPDDGNWVDSINDPGPDAPGRSNNCVDSALATADTYAGNPTAAAHRTPDTNDDGTPSDRGESNGRDRIENTLGARFNDYGNGKDAFNSLENDLRDSGHGSQAVIITQDSNGRAHAWNAVNHNGKITYVDSQTGQRSDTPLHDGSNGVHAIPLDPNRRPAPANSADGNRSDNNDRGTEGERRPAAEPAGTGKGKHENPSESDDDAPPAKRVRTDDPAALDKDPRLERETDTDHTHRSGLPTDDSQSKVREKSPVYRISDHERVDAHLQQWAKDGELAHVLRVAAGDDSHPAASPQKPTTFNDRGLERALPGFSNLNPGERMVVVSTLARLSHSFHEGYGVTEHPVSTDGSSKGVREHVESGQKVLDKLTEKNKQPSGNVENHLPDFTKRNYAVIEVQGPNGTEYVVDSSFPNEAGSAGKHSEKHLIEWIDQVKSQNESSGYKISGLYTEREPCGDKKGGLGGSNCSNLLRERLAGTPVFYSTTYRADQEAIEQRKEERESRQDSARKTQEAEQEKQGLPKSSALPKEEKARINSEVNKEVPQTKAEKEREKQIDARIRKVRKLWNTVGSKV